MSLTILHVVCTQTVSLSGVSRVRKMKREISGVNKRAENSALKRQVKWKEHLIVWTSVLRKVKLLFVKVPCGKRGHHKWMEDGLSAFCIMSCCFLSVHSEP